MKDALGLCVGCFQERFEGSPCTLNGFDETEQRPLPFLPLRTELDNFLVGRQLGDPGGFGVTYLGFDRHLRDRVAIKEFFPLHMAGRAVDGLEILAHSTQERKNFLYGVAEFKKEAQVLARFRHPNIVRVRRFLEAYGTAYLVMDYYEGETLAERLDHQGGRISHGEALALLRPIFDALSREIHPKSYLHRDISPQNLYLARMGGQERPLLLDFGAARQKLGDRSQSLSVVLKPGYAPLEQYESSGRNQGPWTDVYACAATLYRAVTGIIPPTAADRALEDPLQAPNELVPDLPRDFSEAIGWGLEMRQDLRPQTIDQFREALESASVDPSTSSTQLPMPTVFPEAKAEPLPTPPQAPVPPPQPPPPPIVGGLPILHGLSGQYARQEVPLGEALIIGREPTMCQLVLTRGDASRQHCALAFDAERQVFELADLESANGTYLGREDRWLPLRPGQPVTLEHGDRFYVSDPEECFEVLLVEPTGDWTATEEMTSHLRPTEDASGEVLDQASNIPAPAPAVQEAPAPPPTPPLRGEPRQGKPRQGKISWNSSRIGWGLLGLFLLGLILALIQLL